MKKLIRRILSSTEIPYQDQRIFSLNDFIIFLSQIEELKNYDLSIGTTSDGSQLLTIGENTYIVEEP